MSQYETFLKKFNTIVQKVERIMITSHKSADDDSIASVISSYFYLTEKYPNKKIDILYQKDLPTRWKCIEGFEQIKPVDNIAEHPKHYDLLILVDVNAYTRVSDEVENMKLATHKVAIDHHASEPDDFDEKLVDTNCTSCAEVIYNLFYNKKEEDFYKTNEHNFVERRREEKIVLDEYIDTYKSDLDEKKSRAILLGILGDTGSLNNIGSNKPNAAFLIGELLKTANISDIGGFKSGYMTYSKGIFELIQELVKNAEILNLSDFPAMMTSYIHESFLEKYSSEDISAAAHIFVDSYPRGRITGVNWGIIFYPKTKDELKGSFRSQTGVVNVRKITETLEIGGGHDWASGSRFIKPNASIDEFKNLVIEWLKTNSYQNYK